MWRSLISIKSPLLKFFHPCGAKIWRWHFYYCDYYFIYSFGVSLFLPPKFIHLHNFSSTSPWIEHIFQFFLGSTWKFKLYCWITWFGLSFSSWEKFKYKKSHVFPLKIEITIREGRLNIYTQREKPFEKTIHDMGKSLPKAGDE